MTIQLTKNDISKAIKNMTSNIVTVYKSEDGKIHFRITVCCGISGVPHFSCSYRINNFERCFGDSILAALDAFNADMADQDNEL